ncbi:hypothetical protein HOY80DRAFT_950893 [Tuber brumale]|nr:hypothetical protein HOY80DRAFT_950893 [Tuber brumale]
MPRTQSGSQDSSASQTASTETSLNRSAKKTMFHWPTFITIISIYFFYQAVHSLFTPIGTAIQDSPACPTSLVFTTENLLLSEETIGYLPYKPAFETEAPDGSEKRHLSRGLDNERGSKTRQGSGDSGPKCSAGKKACSNLGHPEICCYESHICLPTNNTLTGTYCCGSPDPMNQPCNDERLSCESGWYECPASANGGCCKYGQRCGLLQCFEGGGPASPTSSPTQLMPSPSDPDDDGDGVRGTQDNTSALRTTIRYSASNPSITSNPASGSTKGTEDGLYRTTGIPSSTTPSAPFTSRPTFNSVSASSTRPPSNTPTTNIRSEGGNNFLHQWWVVVIVIVWIAFFTGSP